MNSKLRLAFVIPWYGADIPGGAEIECRNLAQNLAEKSDEVELEVLTTCVKEFSSDWNINYHKPGIEMINNVLVRRFPVRVRNTAKFDSINYKLMNNFSITLQEEEVFFKEMIYSSELNDYISENAEKYDFYVFIPYMFGTTYWGVQACPKKAILIPCLHDESYAHMDLIKKMFLQLRAAIFLAYPEFELAKRIYGITGVKEGVLGAGVETKLNYDAERFLSKYKIDKPFILYAGRKDHGKNVDELVRYFAKYKKQNPDYDIIMLLIGGGDIVIAPDIGDSIVDLGFIPLQDKYDAMAAATVLCQPSLNESFSLVIMESWICGTPVLVNEKCNVTSHFCKISNGGLYYRNYTEFNECLNFFFSKAKIGSILGIQGQQYVLNNFSWDIVTKRYIEFFNSLVEEKK